MYSETTDFDESHFLVSQHQKLHLYYHLTLLDISQNGCHILLCGVYCRKNDSRGTIYFTTDIYLAAVRWSFTLLL